MRLGMGSQFLDAFRCGISRLVLLWMSGMYGHQWCNFCFTSTPSKLLLFKKIIEIVEIVEIIEIVLFCRQCTKMPLVSRIRGRGELFITNVFLKFRKVIESESSCIVICFSCIHLIIDGKR